MEFSIVFAVLVLVVWGVNTLVKYILKLRDTITVLRHEIAFLKEENATQKESFAHRIKAYNEWYLAGRLRP